MPLHAVSSDHLHGGGAAAHSPQVPPSASSNAGPTLAVGGGGGDIELASVSGTSAVEVIAPLPALPSAAVAVGGGAASIPNMSTVDVQQ